MPVSPYIAQLRRSVGGALLLLPSVTVIPRDEAGRILLVRHAGTGTWGTIGGVVEPDEDPASTAAREAAEEAGVRVRLVGILAALGGPQFRVTYPNGDAAAYVSVVYEARIESGTPRPDGEETDRVAWVAPHELAALDLGAHARATFAALGLLD